MAYAKEMEKRIAAAEKTSPLPRSVDYEEINAFYREVLARWDKDH